jgi:hypothetical protein
MRRVACHSSPVGEPTVHPVPVDVKADGPARPTSIGDTWPGEGPGAPSNSQPMPSDALPRVESTCCW